MLGIELKEARVGAGLTQEQCGEICGVSKQTIWSIESGYVLTPHTKTLQAIKQFIDGHSSKGDKVFPRKNRKTESA